MQIEINEYDKKGNQVGSTLANVNNLGAGKTWKFKAALSSECDRYEVKNISGF